MRAAIERIFSQYTRFDIRVLAVRGQRSHLLWTRWSDDDGNETTTFYVNETGDDGRLTYHGRFDEDDFEGAYREFERRYLAGEGVAFAEEGSVAMEWVIALNRGDLDRAFDELMAPGAHTENRSRTAFPDPSVSDPATSFERPECHGCRRRGHGRRRCARCRPTGSLSRLEREAVGRDGETYAWTWLTVSAVRDGRFVSSCVFDVEDEDAAFAYAEERMRATASRLAVTNRATQTATKYWNAMRAHDVDGALDCCSDQLVYDDRRRVSGDPMRSRAELRAAYERLFAQYTQFEARTLAVRGENLHLTWSRSYNDAGFETTCLSVSEIGDDGRFIYEGRFDEDDFESAYRELEKRYYAGEGAAFAEAGATVTKLTLALNRADFDTLFDEITAPDFRIVNRSRSAFPDRSPREYRTTLEELEAMVVSVRGWCSAICWVSPNYGVARCEREALGEDGEQYKWLFLVVFEVRDGRVASMCEFDLEDEDGGVRVRRGAGAGDDESAWAHQPGHPNGTGVLGGDARPRRRRRARMLLGWNRLRRSAEHQR